MSQGGKENLKRVYGHYDVDDYGFSFLPVKMSGSWLTKLIYGPETGLFVCFCLGEQLDKRKRDIRRNWKKYRKHQYK